MTFFLVFSKFFGLRASEIEIFEENLVRARAKLRASEAKKKRGLGPFASEPVCPPSDAALTLQ